MSHWKTKPLSEVSVWLNGLWKGEQEPLVTVGVIRNTNFNADSSLDDSDIAYLAVEKKKYEKRRLEFGDIILEKSGGGPKQPVGRVVLFDKQVGEFSFSNFTSAIRVKDRQELDFKFLHKFLYWMYASGVTEGMQSHSTGIRNLNGDAYKAIQIPLPPLSEQRRIVAILDEAFEAIAAATANAEKNLANARTLFDRFRDSVLADEYGTPTNIGSEVDLLAGPAFKSSGYTASQDGVRLLRGDNVIQNALRWDDVKRWPKNDTAPYQAYALAIGDLVLAMDRTWVKAGLKYATISAEDLPSLLVQRVARLRCQKGLSPKFLAHIIGSGAFEKYVLSIQTGLGVPHISGKQISDFPFVKPDFDEQERVSALLDEMEHQVDDFASNCERKLEMLSELKQSILQKAFSGQISIFSNTLEAAAE